MTEFARRELDIIEAGCKEENELKFQKMIDENIIELVKVFESQGHSGGSAAYMIRVLTRLLNFKPVTPLTGQDDEWDEPYSSDNNQQNKRCGTVFRKNFDNSTATDMEGKIFTDDGQAFYVSRESRVPITFPYYPPDYPERVYLNKVN